MNRWDDRIRGYYATRWMALVLSIIFIILIVSLQSYYRHKNTIPASDEPLPKELYGPKYPKP